MYLRYDLLNEKKKMSVSMHDKKIENFKVNKISMGYRIIYS